MAAGNATSAFRVDIVSVSGGPDVPSSSSNQPMEPATLVVPQQMQEEVGLWVLPSVSRNLFHLWQHGIVSDAEVQVRLGDEGLRGFYWTLGEEEGAMQTPGSPVSRNVSPWTQKMCESNSGMIGD